MKDLQNPPKAFLYVKFTPFAVVMIDPSPPVTMLVGEPGLPDAVG